MRIGLIIYDSLETLSGGYLYDRKLVAHLRMRGDSVEVISIPWRGYRRHLLDNFSGYLLDRLANAGLDLLLQDELNHPSLFLLNGRLRQRPSCPLVSIVHHLRCSEARPRWQNRLYGLVERRYLESVDGFIYNSRATRQAVEAFARERKPGVVAYPAGDRLSPDVRPEDVRRRALEDGPLRLFFLGNLIPRKGLHTLLSALEKLEGEWQLEVCGRLDADVDYSRSIRRRVESGGWADRVKFLGPLPDDALVDRLRSAQALVVPSSYEGFGIVYLEGMGFGLPAIGTTGGGAAEIIRHAENGFLIPPGDADALASCLEAWVNDRRLLAEMGAAALRRYAAHPSWEVSMEKAYQFIHSYEAENG